MLQIVIPGEEIFDEKMEEFYTVGDTLLELEHSLYSISKWEQKWHKPFYKKANKTEEESLDYIKCMTVTKHVDPEIYYRLTPELVDQIEAYMEDPATATIFNEENQPPSRKIYTSEQIYYAMAANNISFECQYWHINRLLTLLRICSIENSPKKKMTKAEIYKRNRELNAKRRKAMGTRG